MDPMSQCPDGSMTRLSQPRPIRHVFAECDQHGPALVANGGRDDHAVGFHAAQSCAVGDSSPPPLSCQSIFPARRTRQCRRRPGALPCQYPRCSFSSFFAPGMASAVLISPVRISTLAKSSMEIFGVSAAGSGARGWGLGLGLGARPSWPCLLSRAGSPCHLELPVTGFAFSVSTGFNFSLGLSRWRSASAALACRGASRSAPTGAYHDRGPPRPVLPAWPA